MGNCESEQNTKAILLETSKNYNQINQINNKKTVSNIISYKTAVNISLVNFYFVFSTGERIPFSGGQNTNFRQIFSNFCSEKCPQRNRNKILVVLFNGQKVDFNKSLSENKIQNGSRVLIMLDNSENKSEKNNSNENKNFNNFYNNRVINFIPIILTNINIIKNKKPQNLHELKEKIEKFFVLYINDLNVQNGIIINLIKDKNVLAEKIRNYYQSRIGGFEFSKNLLLESHLREYKTKTEECKKFFDIKNGDTYTERMYMDDLKENSEIYNDEKKEILEDFNASSRRVYEDYNYDLNYERENYLSEKEFIMENYSGYKRRRELNKLEREHKENIKSIKSDYFNSLKDIRKEKDNRLKENQNNYIERENKIYHRKKIEDKKYDYQCSLNNLNAEYSFNIQNANDKFANNIQMLNMNLTNELNSLEKEFNEELNKLKIFYLQNNRR